MTMPSDQEPVDEQAPAPYHTIDGIAFAMLYEQLAVLRCLDAVRESATCIIAIPSPVGLQLYELSEIMPAKIHPPTAYPDDPFEPEGQDTLIFVARAWPRRDDAAEIPRESSPNAR